MELLMKWVAFSLSVLLAARVLPAVHVRSLGTAIWVAAVYGVLKTLLYWILVFLSLPFIFVTLGLFLIVINAFLLWLTDKLIEGFRIDSFGQTVIASLVISVFDLLLRWILPGV